VRLRRGLRREYSLLAVLRELCDVRSEEIGNKKGLRIGDGERQGETANGKRQIANRKSQALSTKRALLLLYLERALYELLRTLVNSSTLERCSRTGERKAVISRHVV